MRYEPDRGDIVWIMLNPQSGHEQEGRRPALVLSPLKYNSKTGLLICCPITSQEKKYPFEVKIPNGYPVSGVILADQVKNLDWHVREAQFICKMPNSVIEKVIEKISLLLQT
ncbi:endoribonuclease MazF [candidate division KSB1 bacterium]|nr:endoribonuclease MazF [candidate division KSB1 bacterium]